MAIILLSVPVSASIGFLLGAWWAHPRVRPVEDGQAMYPVARAGEPRDRP